MDRAQFEADLRHHGFSEPSEASLAPGERRTPHTHPFDVRGLVVRGEFILARQGVEDHYRPGDTFVLARDCDHFEAAGAEGAVYLVGRLA